MDEKEFSEEQKSPEEIWRIFSSILGECTSEDFFQKDPESSREFVLSLMTFMKRLPVLLSSLCDYLLCLSEKERNEILFGGPKIDGEACGKALVKLSILIREILRDNPRALVIDRSFVEETFRASDFGKLREALTESLKGISESLCTIAEVTSNDPVVVANLAGIIPEIANALIRVLRISLENLNLPPEILASATFNLLGAIEADELGKALMLISRLLVSINEGNMILGRDEPAFSNVLSEFLTRFSAGADWDSMGKAAVALAEDTRTTSSVVAEMIVRDPELLRAISFAIPRILNAVSLSLVDIAVTLLELPDSELAIIGEELEKSFSAENLGFAFDYLVRLALRIIEANPGIHERILKNAIAPINVNEAEKLGRIMLEGVLVSGMSGEVGRFYGPEEVARRINNALKWIARGERKAKVESSYLKRLVRAIDTDEFGKALIVVFRDASDFAFANMDKLVSFTKASFLGLFYFLKGLAVRIYRGFISKDLGT